MYELTHIQTALEERARRAAYKKSREDVIDFFTKLGAPFKLTVPRAVMMDAPTGVTVNAFINSQDLYALLVKYHEENLYKTYLKGEIENLLNLVSNTQEILQTVQEVAQQG